MTQKQKIFAIGVICLLPLSAQALLQACLVVSTGLAFGTYSFVSGIPTTAAGNVEVTCSLLSGLGSEAVSYEISFSTGVSGNYASRRMVNGVHQLQYNLHTQSGANAPIWGDGSSGTSTILDNYTLALLGTVVRNYPVYGRIAFGQNVPIGAYIDTLTVTVNY